MVHDTKSNTSSVSRHDSIVSITASSGSGQTLTTAASLSKYNCYGEIDSVKVSTGAILNLRPV